MARVTPLGRRVYGAKDLEQYESAIADTEPPMLTDRERARIDDLRRALEGS
jgi:hypothetical protein